jgi:glycosyltransferase involved in cell wall biosynthesis
VPGLFPAVREFDLIHLHYPFFFGAELVWVAARLFGVPYVITYHNDVRLTGPLAPVPSVYHWLLGRRILSDAAELLFTTLDYARSSDARDLVERQNTRELSLGVDADRFTASLENHRPRSCPGVGPDDILVLFVASLDRAHYFKGLSVLLDAMNLLRDLPIHLLVVGDGDLRPTYQSQALHLGLGQRVHFTGSVSDADLPRLYAQSDMLVLPSVTRGEAFGLVLLEAMATGKPVIASELPGVRAVVRSTGGGVLVQPRDVAGLATSIRELACAPQERARLGRAGRSAVEANFNWHAVVDKLEGIYSGVVARRRI